MNGNTSDIEWNQKALGLIKDLLGSKLDKTIYIADSKLINLPTLKILRDVLQPIRFISRCPDNFYKKIANKMITKAYDEDNWQEIGQVSNTKKASLYSTQEFTADVEGSELRLYCGKDERRKGAPRGRCSNNGSFSKKESPSLVKRPLFVKPMLKKNGCAFRKTSGKIFI